MPRIALIDDSRIDRRYTSACLQEHGWSVDEVLPYQVSQVVAVLHQRIPDLILLDFSIPGCAGADIARACASDRRLGQVPVVIVTAHKDPATALEIRGLAPAGVLHKPCKQAALVAMVRNVLGGRPSAPAVRAGELDPSWEPWTPISA